MRTELISTNPGRNFETIGHISCSTGSQIDLAVSSAREAFRSWRAMTVEDRIRSVDRYRLLLEEYSDQVARLQSQEMGKPIQQSRAELTSAIRFLKNQIAKAATLLAPRTLDSYTSHRTELHYEPYGVAAIITPWNFPTGQFVANSIQVLLAGNVVVLKHSEECVLTSQFLAELVAKAEFPKNVFQVVYGDGSVGRDLLEREVDFIHFTGSSAVGREIYIKAAEKFVPVTLEMGGSSPAIVMPDVDIKSAARSIFLERFKNAGQICCALKRLYVHHTIVKQLIDELITIAQQQVVGDPLDERTTMGPLAARRQVELLEFQMERARQQGSSIITGGKRPPDLKGAYFEPTIVTGLQNDSPLIQEEVFGPVLPVIEFESFEQAMALANDSSYGLSGFVYCKDPELSKRIVDELEVGQVSVNGASYFSNHAPFGGYKDSGIGRVRGDQGYYEATQTKVVGVPAKQNA